MSQVVAIVDYKMGNLHSVQNAINHLGFDSKIIQDPNELSTYKKIILPGVGAFGQAIKSLHESGLSQSLDERKNSGAQILGICLGMQLMCTMSEEDGINNGLNWFNAKVIKFKQNNNLPVPHMGWNGVDFKRNDPIFKNIQSGGDAYFVHSYYVKCDNAEDILATTDYGLEFTSMIHQENVRGIQFHPEKSQEFGLGMLKNFLEMKC